MFNQWFGAWLGRIFSLPLIIYFFFLSTITLYGLINFIESIFLLDTPSWSLAVAFGIAVFYSVHLGIEIIARVAEWILPWIFVSGFILFFSLLPQKDHSLLLPILEHGVQPVIPVMILIMANLGEMLVMLMINVRRNPGKSIGYTKIYLITMVVNLFTFLGTAIGPVAIFGEELLQKMNYPIQSTTRMMTLGFIERLDAFGLTLVIVGSFVRLGILHYATSLAVSEWLKVKNYRIVNWLVGVALIIVSLVIFGNFREFNDFLKNVYPYGIFFAGLLVLIWLALASKDKVQNRKRKAG